MRNESLFVSTSTYTLQCNKSASPIHPRRSPCTSKSVKEKVPVFISQETATPVTILPTLFLKLSLSFGSNNSPFWCPSSSLTVFLGIFSPCYPVSLFSVTISGFTSTQQPLFDLSHTFHFNHLS